MRVSGSNDGLRVLAIAGNHVVLLGWDMDEEQLRAQQVLGFGIRRQRHADGQVKWLEGMKTFASVEPYPAPGWPVSSFYHPFQTFQWADYGAAPGQTYSYRVEARCAPADQLRPGPAVELTLTTEPIDQGEHAVFFNRGAIASQEYARRFQNRPPGEIGPAAYTWLSRGLIESLEQFIAQAERGDRLLGAFFEFKNERIYSALNAAVERGVEVRIRYDGDSQGEANKATLDASEIQFEAEARIHSGGFAHNKFLLWCRAGQPKEVWTGSTNLSENGLFGHSNNAHLIRNEDIAARYERYWQLLDRDLTRKPTATEVETLSPLPLDRSQPGASAVFSPRLSLDALDWYARLSGGADRSAGSSAPPLFGTFAFGMNERFVEVFGRDDGVLRYALMEKKGSGIHYAEQAAEIDRIRRLPNLTVAVGHRLKLNAFDRWLAETDRAVAKAHVMYVHTKYMLIDPLGEEPIVIVGSANFSEGSTTKNDENMLVIRGDSAVADIYLGEFMRLFTHYAYRESLSHQGALDPEKEPARRYLIESTEWIQGADGRWSSYYLPGSARALRRQYFAGG